MKTPKKLSLALILSALFITACGNKGPLFLPENPEQDATKQTESDIKKEKIK